MSKKHLHNPPPPIYLDQFVLGQDISCSAALLFGCSALWRLGKASHVEDLLSFSEIAKTFEKKLDSIPEGEMKNNIGIKRNYSL